MTLPRPRLLTRQFGTDGMETTRPASSRCAPPRRRRLATRALVPALRLVLVGAALGASLLLSAGSAWAFPPFDDCKSPPIPEAPDAGLTGTFDPNILMSKGGDSRLGKYGYGGLNWSTFDLGCGGAMRDPGAATDTMFGNAFLSIAVDSLALYSGLHQLTAPSHAEPGPLSPIDPAPISAAADQTSTALYNALFSPWAGVGLAVAAMATLLAAGRADAGAVLTRGALIIVALGVSALSFGGGAQLSTTLRESVTDALDSASQAVGQQLGYDAARGPRAMVFDGLLWPAWRVGEVGAHGSDELANQLYINQALSIEEALALHSPGQDRQKLYTDKGNAWKQAAAGAQTSDIASYNNIQGRGESRAAAGVLALIQVGPLVWFQILTELLQLCLLVFLTLLPVGAPLLGLAGLVLPGVLEKAVKTIAAVVAGGIIASLAGLVQLALATKLIAQQGVDQHTTGGSQPSWVVTLVILGVTLVLLALVRPFTSLRGMLISSTSRPSRRLLSSTQRVVLAGHVLARSSVGSRGSGGRTGASRPDPSTKPDGSPNGDNKDGGNGTPRRPTTGGDSPSWPRTSSGGGSRTSTRPAGDPGGPNRTRRRVAGLAARTGGGDLAGATVPSTGEASKRENRAAGRVGLAPTPAGAWGRAHSPAQSRVAESAPVYRPTPRPYVRPTVTPEFREPRPAAPPDRDTPARRPRTS